ncbi:Clavaminate synthase-like protein [Calocera viscosa TUFC12733]|uniref:Clavaminate synthase-like protein n=1 Tax=Calocera viscosa (strain TUFC12733) TaxID=1330018 RepID=A0A167Q762_CALVF|nr:Clavaminate synthase-like protein [Calocera viscosa TUFC12733]
MPVAVPLTVKPLHYEYVKPTKVELDWAELVTVDLGDLSTPEGKQRQAKGLIDALRIKGFFYVKNFNISQERVDRQFAIGNTFYNDTPLEEKLKYEADLKNGSYNGYIPHGRSVIDKESGIKSNVEFLNIPKFNGFEDREWPTLITEHLPEIEEFSKALNTEVLYPLYKLLAIALELPENYFVDLHRYENNSEDHLRYMKYHKRTPEENKKLNGIWGRGHTDLGGFTLLFRQPVAALQIKDHTDGKWRWVKALDGTITVNACDALSFLTGNYVKSTIHRVAAPPADQENVDRLGVLYFSRPKSDTLLATIKESPVLQREGYTQNDFEKEGVEVPTSGGWTISKQRWNFSNYGRETGEQRTPFVIPGYESKYFD